MSFILVSYVPFVSSLIDIIALLIIGVIMVVLFVLWERYLEQVQDDPSRSPSLWTPPPLMRPSIWARAKGRMAVILAIAFLNWSAFISWSFWVQVCAVGIRLSATTDRVTIIAILPELSATNTREYHGPVHSHVYRRDFV